MEEAQLAPAREHDHGDDDADEAAVERHPAMPEENDLAGMAEIIGSIVEDDIADAAAQHDAQDRPADEIVEHGGRQRAQLLGRECARVAPAEEDAEDIGERIPADGKRSDLDQHRIDHRKGNGEEHGAVIGGHAAGGKPKAGNAKPAMSRTAPE